MNRKDVIIYTDGACAGNPGVGGWAAVILFPDRRQDICGSEVNTTNNQMELLAVINGLKELKVSCNVNLYTDSMYIKRGITEWINKWKVNGWQTSKKRPVKNIAFWKELDSITQRHTINWHWVKSHNGDTYNVMADNLAREICSRRL